MKKLYIFLLLILTFKFVIAQTWTGNTSTNWAIATNWSPNGVPAGASNVTIPASVVSGNWPAFSGNVTINSINMVAGSQLNVNGFTLTINGINTYNYFTGAILNNTNGATDIVLNIYTGTSGYATYFRSNTVNDNIIFNLTGTSTGYFYEGDVAPANQFNGNATYNINDVLPVYISNSSASQYAGNLTINRTVAGSTSMFGGGAAITGNFLFTNNAGGANSIGSIANKTNIAGTINITALYPSSSTFSLYRIINQTTGGIINVQNSTGLDLRKDTLKVASLSVTGYKSGAYGYFLNNAVTGNVTLSDDASNSGGWETYLRSNTITGNASFTNNGSNAFYDADGAADANTYNGNVTYNGGGSGALYIAYAAALQCTGNVSINRTAAGITRAFNSGANITGNLAYVNNTAGDTYFGNNNFKTSIGGTINIEAAYSIPNYFEMYRLINQTNGGNINVQNSQGFNIQKDTIKITSIGIIDYTGNQYGYLYNNNISGNVTISSAATYINGYVTYIHNNIITGTSTFTSKGPNNFTEADAAGTANHYIGTTNFNAAGTGSFFVSHADASLFDGNINFNRTVVGITYIFNNGGIVNGNFSYTNNTAGNTYLGTPATKTSISGTINIAANYTAPSFFEMYRLINQTSGGSINVQNSQGFNIQKDTIKIASMGITAYTGNQNGYFYNNSISGNVTLSSDATYSSGYSTHMRNNLITGTSTFTNNGNNSFNEADAAGSANHYIGATIFNAAGSGTFIVSHLDASQFDGNISFNRTVAGITYIFNNGGIVNGNFSYTNNTAGNTYLGNPATKTSISGTVNIAANYSSPNFFEMHRLINQTGGGVINVQNPQGFNVQKDTLIVNALSITGYRGNTYANFYNNNITGNVTTADDVSYSSGYETRFQSNTVIGNVSIASNGSNPMKDPDAGPQNSRYTGNVTYTKTGGGTLSIGIGDTLEIGQNLTLNSPTGILLGTIKFNGNSNGVIDQLGTQQPIIIPTIIMDKTGSAKLTLNDSVTVTNTLTFASGNIYSSAGNNLIFPDNVSYTGGSANSHVVGPVTKVGDDIFTFPLGSPTTLNTVAMSAPVGVASRFRAEYKNQNPTSDGYNTNLKAGSFGAAGISKVGYWDVQRLTGTTNVTLTEGFASNPYEQYPVLANLKVAHWNGAQWDDHGNGGTTGTSASGTVINSVPITSFSPFALAGVTSTYFYKYSNPGAGPDGTAVKFGGIGGYAAYSTKQLPGGSYSLDSIYLIPNASSVGFKLKDFYGVEKDDTTVTAPAAPVTYIAANGNGTKNFTGWRHFVYMTNVSNQIIGAIRDNNYTLGNTTMTAYFSTANVATAPNGSLFLKRSFKITSQFAPAGTKRVRFYISKTEFNNLVAADPTSFPSGINSLTITKYNGPQEDSLFNPIPGGNSSIIPNSAISIADLGTMYSLDIDVTGFSGFYIAGNNSKLNVCSGSTITIPSNVSGASYQWQADSGSGFANISNTGSYSGTTSSSLTITSIPTTMYGYKFKCLVNGVTLSQEYTIKLSSSWEGAISNVWENTANWSCGVIPDAATDVVIKAGKANYPQVGASTSVRTLTLSTGATLTVKTGFNLSILK